MAEGTAPPLAIVGSSNTVLTVALAEALRDASQSSGKPGPVLLVPWATSVSVEATGNGPATVPLLSIYPGRTFRFCADNQRLADLAVECLASREPKGLPRRAFLVVERADSFSKDLADCFTRAISAVAPRAEVDTYDLRVEGAERVGPRGADDDFGPAERGLAGRLWRAALEVPGREMAWIVLPLQEEPSLRMLKALRGEVWWDLGKGEEAGPLRVLCGDGLGRDTLQDLAATHDLPFPVWGVSSSSNPEADAPAHPGSVIGASSGQVPAEIVAALLHCLDAKDDGTPSPEGLRNALAAIDLKAGDLSALGRPLGFAPSGERKAADLGRVLEVRPGRAAISVFAKGPKGAWTESELAAPGAIAAPTLIADGPRAHPLSRLHATLGTPGLVIGLLSLLSFAFGLYALARGYDQFRDTSRGAPASRARRVGADHAGRSPAADPQGLRRSLAAGGPRRSEGPPPRAGGQAGGTRPRAEPAGGGRPLDRDRRDGIDARGRRPAGPLAPARPGRRCPVLPRPLPDPRRRPGPSTTACGRPGRALSGRGGRRGRGGRFGGVVSPALAGAVRALGILVALPGLHGRPRPSPERSRGEGVRAGGDARPGGSDLSRAGQRGVRPGQRAPEPRRPPRPARPLPRRGPRGQGRRRPTRGARRLDGRPARPRPASRVRRAGDRPRPGAGRQRHDRPRRLPAGGRLLRVHRPDGPGAGRLSEGFGPACDARAVGRGRPAWTTPSPCSPPGWRPPGPSSIGPRSANARASWRIAACSSTPWSTSSRTPSRPRPPRA